MTVDFLLVCDYAGVLQDGKLCLMGIVDHVAAAAFPHRPRELYVAARVRSGLPGAVIDTAFAVHGPRSLVCREPAAMEIDVHGRGVAYLRLPDLYLETPGVYRLSLELNGRALASRTVKALRLGDVPTSMQ